MKHFSLADYIEDEAEVESDCSKDEEDNEECEQEPEGIDEAKKISSLCPDIKMMPMASTGCASANVYHKMGIHDADMESNLVFLSAFRKLLEPYKEI